MFGRGVPAVTLLFTWVILVGVACSHQSQVKRRQISLPPGISARCINGFFSLDGSDRDCLLRLGESFSIRNATITVEFSVDQLNLACGSANCQRALVTLIEACENEVRSAIDLPAAVDLDSLLSLLCVKDQNDSYCYFRLERPILENDHDPLLLCDLLSPQAVCSNDCRIAISPFQSTCCLVSYLYLVAGDSIEQQNIATSNVWSSCNLTAPSICPGINSLSNNNASNPPCVNGNGSPDNNASTSPVFNKNTNSNNNNNNNNGAIVGGVIGGLVVILLITILVIQLIYLIFKYRARSIYGVNDKASYQGDGIKVTLADHEHTAAMTT